MDDLQFRKEILADPQCNADNIANAKKLDPAKQQFAQEIEELDNKIKSALNVPVPKGMVDTLILRQTLNSHQRQKKKRVHLAIAASVALVIGLTVNFMVFNHEYDNVADYAFAHTEHEAEFYTNNDKANISLTSLNDKMATFKGKFTSTMGEIILARFCFFDGMQSIHLIYKGEKSPVNVFIIPENDHLTVANNFSNNDFNGTSKKFAHGHIIVVGDKNESLDKWQQQIENNVLWSI